MMPTGSTMIGRRRREGAIGQRLLVTSGGIPLLVSGEADAATNSSTQAVLRSVAAPNLRVILTVAECSYRVVARRSAGVTRVSGLRGKKVGTPLNTSAHFYLSKMLRTAGVLVTGSMNFWRRSKPNA